MSLIGPFRPMPAAMRAMQVSSPPYSEDLSGSQMPRQRVLNFHRVNGRDRSGNLASNGECERASILPCHLAGNVRFETIRTWSDEAAERIGRE